VKRLRRLLAGSLVLSLLYLLLAATGAIGLSLPVDVALNLGRFPHDAALEAPPGGPRLVVLQHGFFRTGWSLWKLERALEDHGYEVFNPSYPSRAATIEEHAQRLGSALREHLHQRAQPPAAIAFVGHSMGGLVIRCYLGSEGAAGAAAVVFLGTPQRGAIAAVRHRETWFGRLVTGERAGRQLMRGDPFYANLAPLRAPAGTVIGGRGDADGASARIPGDDDGRVGVDEARLEGAQAMFVRAGHTALCTDDAVIAHVLRFLRTQRFGA
jgi:pimeloyl-ACP methyl ester carboxylesterase